MIRFGWSAAQASYPWRDRPRGTVVPWKSKRVGAEKTQTEQMMVKATATIGMTMARPAGMRAR